ncbi:ribonuclease E/G, partial [Microbacterium sp.]|uniref:ribonuclease E/G n=1 Tax=Microbacterium sp. TaxID=51671 RepID=UPI00273538FB
MVLESNRDLVLRRLIECLSRDRTKHQVAEVTSLGLVQMTRKKLGLGLLETFSEPCEVCAGRGVVVHHDPVVKHRSSSTNGGSSNNRRQRGGNGQSSQSTQPSSAATHSIPEGAKTALAQIAASTRAPSAETAAEAVAEAPATADAEQPAAAERPKKPRKKRSSERGKAAPKTQAEQLLDSVLDALPEPKAPGQGRNRRRVTTAALTGTPVSVNSSATAVAGGDSES